MVKPNPTKSYHDALYGNFEYPEDFEPILCSKPIRRLMRVKQLGLLDYVYPGGDYNRFAHSVGVMHVMGTFMDRLLFNSQDLKGITDNQKYFWKRVAMLSGLFHDVGHGPLSHGFESVSEPDHETVGREIINEFFIKNSPRFHYLDAEMSKVKKVLDVAYCEGNEHRRAIKSVSKKDARYIFCISKLLSGSFDLDKLDYLRRDLSNVGLGFGSVDFDWLRDNINFKYDRENGFDGSFIYFTEDCCTALQEFLFQRVAYYWKCIHHRQAELYGRIAEKILSILKSQAKRLFNPSIQSDPLFKYLRQCDKTHVDWDSFLNLDDSSFWELVKKVQKQFDVKTERTEPWIGKVLRLYSGTLISGKCAFKCVFETGNIKDKVSPEKMREIGTKICKGNQIHPDAIDYYVFDITSSVKGYLVKEGKDIMIRHRYKDRKDKKFKFFPLLESSLIKSIAIDGGSICRTYVYSPNGEKKEIQSRLLKIDEDSDTFSALI